MINFIFGTYGSGKTTEIFKRISEDTQQKKRCFLIIPDQEAVVFERRSLGELPIESQLYLETLSFSRLYNRVCREYGGLSYSYITKPIRSLIMWKSLRDLRPLLREYASHEAFDMTLTDLMLSTVGELKASGISAQKLENAAKKLPENSTLAGRLLDVSLIYSCFDNFVSEKYSDSSDDLSKLNDMLNEYDFFCGSNVYVDSFTSFTGVQHKILEHIFKTADNVFITIPLCPQEDIGISGESVERSYKKLRSCAERYSNVNEITLNKNLRSQSPAISYLIQNLWQTNASKDNITPEINGDIVCEVCANPYAEAEAVAAHILKLLKEGARCRDVVVVMRDPEKYRGIIEPALKRSNIPFFFAHKSDLCATSAVKLILSALKIKKFNWQTSDVLAHIKSGLCDIGPTEANLFEEYVTTWKIRGVDFYEKEWTMNPDGFVKERSARAEEILSSANSVRRKLFDSLTKLFILLDAAENVADMCRALYAYLEEIALEDKLSALSLKFSEHGDIKQARETARLYGIILNTLADVAIAIGDETADSEEFMLILKAVFEKTEISSIPTSIDEVNIGSASMIRASNQKYAFVMGLCEGEFPAAVNDTGIFSSSDIGALADLGIELSSDIDTRSSDELMYVERAFSIPSERLYLFTHSSQIGGGERFPSLAFNRVEKLFNVKPHLYVNGDLDYIVPAPKNASTLLRSLNDGVQRRALSVALEEYIPGISENFTRSSKTQDCTVSADTMSSAFGDSLYFSPSSFEKYVKCPFSYYCSNVLQLREEQSSSFKANDIGTFIHFILEQLLKNSIPKDPTETISSDEAIIENTDKAVKAYIEDICPTYLLDSKRMKHLYSRLRALALLLIKNIVEEFSQSVFRPFFFELRANGVGENPSPLVFTLKDGTKVTFGGIVDRVDVYKCKDKVYLRVVDYKTGTKNFSLEDIDHGLNLQMLLYLFTLCRSSSTAFKQAIGAEDATEMLPAGIIYLSANIPLLETDEYEEIDTVRQNAAKRLERSGMLLDDENVLRAMNSELDSSFIAGIRKRTSDGTFTGSALTSAKDFCDVYEKLEKVIVKFASELRSGRADAEPLKYGKSLPCEFCSARPICRNTKN